MSARFNLDLSVNSEFNWYSRKRPLLWFKKYDVVCILMFFAPRTNLTYPMVAVRISVWPSASGAGSASWARAAGRPVWWGRTPARRPRCSDPRRRPLVHVGHRCRCSRLVVLVTPGGPATDAPGRWKVPCYPHLRATAESNDSRGW